MWTVVVLQGRTPKRAIGEFKTADEAHAWARQDGWQRDQYMVIPFDR